MAKILTAMSIETTLTVCLLLGFVGWLALDCYMGWTTPQSRNLKKSGGSTSQILLPT